ncbi:phosphotransferase family protein [Actinopolymorpha pittospori]|uniref:Ser/Thr protein kinase RdoA (MazF antagonist) n=1 Tax=Actinopolymorpha pittospori TaxID=648752 RepID=A0A927N4R5_9ACTN|nr:aminoglycoside phosphotransferase family protein [Actinopolymorpha pittospori]MBE1612074.1 Ser/Thr protein kinase RdoA (MazF antagonist) [Actinopolymorpha pittospori]
MSMQPGSFVEWQHAQVSTPRSVLAEVVRHAVGTRIEQVDRIVEGYENEVYRVRCADGQDVVVRILRFGRFSGDSTRSAAEARAIGQARAAGVPAPEILLLDTVRIDGTEFPVMVQRTVPGRPLAEVVTSLSERQRHDVLAEIGGLIARISGVHVNDERDWPTAMAAELADRRSERDQVLAGGFSAAQFDQMLDLLEGYVHDFPCQRWVLCHGDLSPQHIFVTGDGTDGDAVRVSGIIDFGDWKPGAPVHDLAVLRVRGPKLDLAPLLAGYGAHADDTYRRRLDLHTLDIALSSLWIGVDEDDQACIERSSTLIRVLLANLGVPAF